MRTTLRGCESSCRSDRRSTTSHWIKIRVHKSIQRLRGYVIDREKSQKPPLTSLARHDAGPQVPNCQHMQGDDAQRRSTGLVIAAVFRGANPANLCYKRQGLSAWPVLEFRMDPRVPRRKTFNSHHVRSGAAVAVHIVPLFPSGSNGPVLLHFIRWCPYTLISYRSIVLCEHLYTLPRSIFDRPSLSQRYTHSQSTMTTSKFTEILDASFAPSMPEANVSLEECLMENRQRSASSSSTSSSTSLNSTSRHSIAGVAPPLMAPPTSPISRLRAMSLRRKGS